MHSNWRGRDGERTRKEKERKARSKHGKVPLRHPMSAGPNERRLGCAAETEATMREGPRLRL